MSERVDDDIIERAINWFEKRSQMEESPIYEVETAIILRSLLSERRAHAAEIAELRGVPIRDRDICGECGSGLVHYRNALDLEISWKIAEARRMLEVIAAFDPVEEPFDIQEYARRCIDPWLRAQSTPPASEKGSQ